MTQQTSEKPLISFVIPNYNYGKFLKPCIDSCLQHKTFSHEVLVQDGGSTDNTIEILQSYGNSIDWVSRKDNGQSDAINSCIRRARGDYIAWINSDDYYPGSKPLDKVAAILRENPGIDLVYGDAEYVYKDGAPYRYITTPNPLTWQRLAINPFKCILQPCIIFRRELFLELGCLDETIHYAMDPDLWLRILMREETTQVYIPVVIAHARIHADAKTRHEVGKTVRDIRRVLRKHKTFKQLSITEKIRSFKAQRIADLYKWAIQLGVHNPPR